LEVKVDIRSFSLCVAALCASPWVPAQSPPEAAAAASAVASRTQGQNFKDLALSSCIASAYATEPKAAADAGATASTVDTHWNAHDSQLASNEIAKLVDSFLKRDYSSQHNSRIRFDLLKCLDLYHSKELDQLTKRMVAHPARSSRGARPGGK
jgi:hypothetical protein